MQDLAEIYMRYLTSSRRRRLAAFLVIHVRWPTSQPFECGFLSIAHVAMRLLRDARRRGLIGLARAVEHWEGALLHDQV